jgi:hypothetical protein
VGPRAGLDDVEKILDPTRTRTPTRNLPLYGLFYVLNSSLMYKPLNPRSTSSDFCNATTPVYILIDLLR